MAKRKCIRPAIIELSDSEEDDQATDDCVIVESSVAISRKKETPPIIDITSNSTKRQGQRSRDNESAENNGESRDCSDDKGGKSGCSEASSVVSGSRNDKSDAVVGRGRKRKIAESADTKMGLSCSKTEPNEADRLREYEEAKEKVRIRLLAEHGAALRKGEILAKHRLRKTQEDANLRQSRDEQQRQENSRQQQLQRRDAPSFARPSVVYPSVPAPRVPSLESQRNAAAMNNSSSPPSQCERIVSPETKPRSNDTPETYAARLAETNVSCVEWTEIDFIQESHGISRHVAENVAKLFKEDNTIPFIARYRKNMTQGMDADELRNLKNSYDKAKLIKQKAGAIIREIDKQGKWTAEFHNFVNGTKSLNDLEHIHSMFKVTKSTLAERARNLGLDAPAGTIIKGEKIDSLRNLVKPRTEGLRTEEQVRDGLICILADMINKDENTFETMKNLRSEYSMTLEITKMKKVEKTAEDPKSSKQKSDENKYDLYHNFSSSECNLKPHQILAINRGESRKILSVKVNIPDDFERRFKEYCAERYGYACAASPLHRALLTAAYDYAWNKSLKSSIRRRTRHELNERAEIASMDVFAENVKQLLLTPPVRGKIVMGVDPGFRHGCKLAVVSEQGDVLETETIYPHDSNNFRERQEAERILERIVRAHGCTIFALGNGTACRETEVFLAELIKKRIFEPLSVVYSIVDETGASIYSCSREATTEFPDLDVNVVSAISIARRLQDPMAELVKIEPKHLGVGMYQHDLPEKQLAAKLNEVIMEAVSFVGVDVNTASVSLLKRVAGLGDSKARHIIERRKSSGPFRTRNDLMKVPGIGSKTFEQCAGFIRIMPETAVVSDRRSNTDSFNYLDQTWIHPESYEIARAFISAARCNIEQIGTKSFIFAAKLFAERGYAALAKSFGTTAETMRTIVDGLSMTKGQDIRAKADVSMFRKSLTRFDDLRIGTILTGVVRNNTHFGAFVDVGVERAGLIHKSQMGGITLSVGQRVETTVQNIEKERGRLGLTLIRCF